MYLIAVTIGLCVTYASLTVWFPYFFNTGKVTVSQIKISSLIFICTLSLLGYAIAFSITDIELSNRFLHAFGGGFMAFMTCFLSARDSHIALNKIRFLFFSLLIITTLGVASELIEFLFQNLSHFVFAETINDTWLDLASNLVGSFIGAIVLFPFLNFNIEHSSYKNT